MIFFSLQPLFPILWDVFNKKATASKADVNFMDINHVSEIVFLLAVAVGFSVGFHNIGGGAHSECHSIDSSEERVP